MQPRLVTGPSKTLITSALAIGAGLTSLALPAIGQDSDAGDLTATPAIRVFVTGTNIPTVFSHIRSTAQFRLEARVTTFQYADRMHDGAS